MGLTLDVETANLEVLKWLRDVANVRVHQTTQEQPAIRWKQELADLQAYEQQAAQVINLAKDKQLLTPNHYERVNLQHALSVYEDLLMEAQA